jgi:hypothetical protein
MLPLIHFSGVSARVNHFDQARKSGELAAPRDQLLDACPKSHPARGLAAPDGLGVGRTAQTL